MQPKQIALLAKKAAEDKKAEDPVVLNISRLTSIAHYFVVSHGNSDRQVKAIAHSVIDALREKGVKAYHVEGMESGTWVLVDFGTVIVHVFHRDTREFYAIERLWGEAPQLT